MVNGVQKGKSFQWKVSRIIATALGVPMDEIYSAHGGKTERDIQQSERVKQLFPYHIECKNQKTHKLREWLSQAEKDAAMEDIGLVPMVIHKFHGHSSTYVTLSLEDFLFAICELTPEDIKAMRKIERG